MPRKKTSRKRSALPSASRAEPPRTLPEETGTSGASETRESLFNDFSSGLAVASAAAATSSPSAASAEHTRLSELKKTLLMQLEDERSIVETNIRSIFDRLDSDLCSAGNAGKMIYNAENFGKGLTVVEAAAKVIQDSIRAEAVSKGSRKVTWNCTNNCENMPPPSGFRRLRRSRSVEPIGTHTTILSHRPRPTSSDRLGLRTPARNGGTFNFGIATVTPHPQFSHTANSMTVLRKPNPGETAISMSGSPLMVSAENGSSPSITVPLSDGRVFKVLGRASPFKEEMRRGLDEETKRKLKNLKDFIGELV